MHEFQTRTNGNAPPPQSPQKRARLCKAIGRQLALESFYRKNSKREARARMAIGLRPFSREWR